MRTPLILLVSMLLVVLANAAIIFSFQPHVVNPGPAASEREIRAKQQGKNLGQPTDWLAKSLEYTLDDSLSNRLAAAGAPNIEMQFVSRATSGGILGVGSAVEGYVDMASPDPTLILTVDSYNMTSLAYHEAGHVIQKRLIADEVGGYPSTMDVGLSASYYSALAKLETDLVSLTPKLAYDEKGEGKATMFPGIEASADCIGQLLGWKTSPTNILPGQYAERQCNVRELATANAMLNGEWPTEANTEAYLPETQKILDNAFDWPGWDPSIVGQEPPERTKPAIKAKTARGHTF